MAKNSPSVAKNQMRRCLKAILDPHPSKDELAELWLFFGSECAYCGLSLQKSSRDGHVDHIVSQSNGGANSIYNHVLSCARCNGDEKREEHWESFLRSKVSDPAQYESRRSRIELWLTRAPVQLNAINAQQVDAELIIKSALESFDYAVKKMRTLREART